MPRLRDSKPVKTVAKPVEEPIIEEIKIATFEDLEEPEIQEEVVKLEIKKLDFDVPKIQIQPSRQAKQIPTWAKGFRDTNNYDNEQPESKPLKDLKALYEKATDTEKKELLYNKMMRQFRLFVHPSDNKEKRKRLPLVEAIKLSKKYIENYLREV